MSVIERPYNTAPKRKQFSPVGSTAWGVLVRAASLSPMEDQKKKKS